MIAKITIYLIAGLLALSVLGGGVYLYMNLGNISKMIAENVASEAMGVKVSIGDVDVGLKDKRVVVSDIKIRNPRGYSKPYIMTIKTVNIKAGGLSKSVLEFDDVKVSGTDVYVEVKNGTTNLHALRDQVNAIAAKRKAKAKATGSVKDKADAKASAAIKIILKKASLSGVILHPSFKLLGEQNLKPVKLNTIYLSGIGTRSNGVVAQDAVSQITAQLMKKLNEYAASSGYLSGLSKKDLREMGVSQVRGKLKEITGGNDEQVEKVIDAVGGKLKDLF